jgi:uncharacterized protein (DUF1015 family)
MPDIQAFHALRYDLGHVGALSDVVAPPYDVISPQLQDQLYERHPANVIRLILNREQPGDNETHHRYQRAAQFWREWRSQGVLQADPNPGLYVYHQQFEYAGRHCCGAASWLACVSSALAKATSTLTRKRIRPPRPTGCD